MDGGAWQATVLGVTKSRTRLSDFTFTSTFSMYNIKAVLSYFEDVLKNLPANAGDIGDVDSVPGSRRSPGGRNGNPLQYSCLENACYTPWGCKESEQVKQLSMHAICFVLDRIVRFQVTGVLSNKLDGKFCCSVFRPCPTLCDSMDYSLPGSSVHGVFQARILEWVAMPSSRESSQPRD